MGIDAVSLGLIGPSDYERMVQNWRANRAQQASNPDGPALDPAPIVHLFVPGQPIHWLLTEIDPDLDVAFGLADLGMGCPELGDVALEELVGGMGAGVTPDPAFEPVALLSQYLEAARAAGGVVLAPERFAS